MTAPSYHEQAVEAELHYLALRDYVTRASNGKIKRPPHDVDRARERMVVAEHLVATVKAVANRTTAQPAGARP